MCMSLFFLSFKKVLQPLIIIYLRVFEIFVVFGFESGLGDLPFVDDVVVGEERALFLGGGLTPLAVEVPVRLDRLAAEVAHLRPALARHLVAAVDLDEGLFATPALAHQRLRHLVLDVRPLADLGVFLHLFAPFGNVTDLLAQPATLLTTVGVLTVEDLKKAIRFKSY